MIQDLEVERRMERVIYTGASDAQVRWGNNSDPRGVLTEGRTYDVEKIESHSWHTKLKLVGVDGWFNSACFDHNQ